MADQEQDRGSRPFHQEGSEIIFDRPEDQKERARKTRENEQHEFQRAQVKANQRIAAFSGILVFATFCTIAVGVFQNRISQKAANAARDAADTAQQSADAATVAADTASAALKENQRQFAIDERAYLSFPGIDGSIIVGQPLRFILHLKNSGKTYAEHVSDHVIADRVDIGKGPKFSDETFTPDYAIIPPNEEMLIYKDMTKGQPLQASDYALIQTGKISIYLHGRVWYDDVFGSHHWIRVCVHYIVATSSIEVCKDPKMALNNAVDNKQE